MRLLENFKRFLVYCSRRSLISLSAVLVVTVLMVTGCGGNSGASGSIAASENSSPAQTSADSSSAIPSKAQDGTISISMLDVGQGDAILIKTAAQTILIDTSDVDERTKLMNQLKKAGVDKLDKIILTHPHADHIGGIEPVLKTYSVGTIYDNGMPNTSKVFINYMKLAKSKGISIVHLVDGNVIDLGGGASFTVISPSEKVFEAGQEKGYKHDPNNESVVGIFQFGNFRMLFTGDAEATAEKNYVAAHNNLQCQVLKAPHHGSKTSSSAAMLRAVKPELVIISCGAGNDYGHPHKESMKKYAALNATVLETDQNGTITITSDGNIYKVVSDK